MGSDIAGDRSCVLPQDEREGVLYLGIAGDEIPAGAFNNEAVDLNLVAVNGPGNVFLYATDAFGSPTKYYDSADGIGSEDVFPVSVGGHAHQTGRFPQRVATRLFCRPMACRQVVVKPYRVK